ncbi:hypothetical protein [Streptomyces roseoviridis]|uniref:Sensor histidine kinase n=1 Tax=Streptomyces roseoviridis TaxID=67361 RepID=A0ABV5QQD6_9ACTN
MSTERLKQRAVRRLQWILVFYAVVGALGIVAELAAGRAPAPLVVAWTPLAVLGATVLAVRRRRTRR